MNSAIWNRAANGPWARAVGAEAGDDDDLGVGLLRGLAAACIFVTAQSVKYSDAFVLIENEIWVVFLRLC